MEIKKYIYMITTKLRHNQHFLLLFIIILCGFQFFNYYGIDPKINKMVGFLITPCLILVSLKTILSNNKDIMFRLMRLLLISWVLSFFMALFFWGQSLDLTYRASSQMLFFVVFFYLCKYHISRSVIEKIIVLLGWLYIVLWLYALYRVPEVTFGLNADNEITDISRGIYRLSIVGRLIMILTYFFYLNKAFIEKHPKYKIFVIIFFVVIVLQVTRQLILWTAILSLIYLFMERRKLAVILAILFFISYHSFTSIQFSNDSVVGAMINLTNDQFDNQLYNTGEDPRITEYKFFFRDWSPSLVNDLLGNGMPHSDSDYGKFYLTLQSGRMLFLSDVGYGSIFVILGVVGIILYLLIFIKPLTILLPKDLDYVKLFMGFMIPANIAASWYFGADGALTIAFCAYLVYQNKIPKPFADVITN